MKTRQEILDYVKEVFASDFEIDPADISDDVDIFSELGLDSIDAVDLVVKLQDFSGSKLDPVKFKKVRTVGDMVTAIGEIIKEQ